MARLQILELPEGANDERPPFMFVLDQISSGESDQIIAAQDDFNGVARAAGACAIVAFHGMTVDLPANDPPPVASNHAAEDAEPEDNGPRNPGRDCGPGCCVDNDSFAPTTCAFCGSREHCVNHPGEAALAQGAPGHPFSPSGPRPDDPERAGTTQIVYAHERTRLDLCTALLLSGDTTWRKIVETVGKRQRELADLYRKSDTAIVTARPLTKKDIADVIRQELDRAARMGHRGMR